MVGSDKSDLWDDEQMIILESVTDETRQNLLCGNCLCFRFLTNDSKDVAAIDGYAKKFSEIKGRIVSDEGYDNYSSDGTMEDFDNTIVYLIYGFAIVNCLFSAVLWVYVRMQEIVISRICGMSSTRVFLKLVMEIFVVCSCACIALVICIIHFVILRVISLSK